MTVLVADVSVGVKWLVPEVHAAEALRLLGPNYELHASAFISVEAANVFWKKFRAGELSRDEAADRLAPILRERAGFGTVCEVDYRVPDFRRGCARYAITRVQYWLASPRS